MKTSVFRMSPCVGVATLVTSLAVSAGSVRAQTTTTFELTAIASGNWNAAGVHTLSNYQIGYSSELPNKQVAYFEFDLDPIKGRTVVGNELLIVGSTDYNIETTFTNACGTAPCFKVGIVPEGTFTTDQVVNPTSNNSTAIYLSGGDANRNQDIGYEWVENGLHPGFEFGGFTYNTARLQNEVNAGGNWVFWARDEFDASTPENYIWGNTAYNTGISMIVTVNNGSATTATVQNGSYQIKNLNSGLALEVPAGHTAQGTLVDQAPYTGANNQRWTVTQLANGNYTITNVATGQLLDVQHNSHSAGAPIDIWPANGNTNQQWTFKGTFDGNYTITAVNSGLFLDVSGALTLSGTQVIQWSSNGIANQQWSLQ